MERPKRRATPTRRANRRSDHRRRKRRRKYLRPRNRQRRVPEPTATATPVEISRRAYSNHRLNRRVRLPSATTGSGRSRQSSSASPAASERHAGYSAVRHRHPRRNRQQPTETPPEPFGQPTIAPISGQTSGDQGTGDVSGTIRTANPPRSFQVTIAANESEVEAQLGGQLPQDGSDGADCPVTARAATVAGVDERSKTELTADRSHPTVPTFPEGVGRRQRRRASGIAIGTRRRFQRSTTRSSRSGSISRTP